MNNNYDNQETIDIDKNKSNIKFMEIFPTISNQLNAKEYISIENSDNPVLLMLDRECGLDGLIRFKNNQLQTVSTRISISNKDYAYDNFTIRYTKNNGAKTEYQKMIERYENNSIRPYYTISVCYSNNDWNAGIIETDLLTDYIINEQMYDIVDWNGNSTFLSIKWKQLELRYKDKMIIIDDKGNKTTTREINKRRNNRK